MAAKKLKDWFDESLAEILSNKLHDAHQNIDTKHFKKTIKSSIVTLELKDRVEVIADYLFENLGGDFKKVNKALATILGPENEEETGMFTEFYWVMPIAKVVEKYGLEYFDISMKTIKEITKRNTGEYTIRPFLQEETQKTLKQMKLWSKDKNRHVRRLSCEGLRPRLPWASKLDTFIKNPKPILPILNNLKDDPSKYVQKSVANCLNDILKDNPNIAKEIIEKWNTLKMGKERKWIIKHSLRNLIKKEDPWAIGIVH